MYCSMSKGTSQAEVMLNSKKTKPIPLHIVELRLTESIRQSVRQAVSIENYNFLYFYSFRLISRPVFALTNAAPLSFGNLRLVFG